MHILLGVGGRGVFPTRLALSVSLNNHFPLKCHRPNSLAPNGSPSRCFQVGVCVVVRCGQFSKEKVTEHVVRSSGVALRLLVRGGRGLRLSVFWFVCCFFIPFIHCVLCLPKKVKK